jgi:hypothetical protein
MNAIRPADTFVRCRAVYLQDPQGGVVCLVAIRDGTILATAAAAEGDAWRVRTPLSSTSRT